MSLYGEPYSMERGFVNILNVGEDMKNILNQTKKVLLLYMASWILLYPVIMIGSLLTGNASLQVAVFCILTACEGVLFWRIKNKDYILKKRNSFRSVKPEFYKNLLIQLITVIVLFILVCFKEINQIWWFPTSSCWHFL